MSGSLKLFGKGLVISVTISLAMGLCNYFTRRTVSLSLSAADFGFLYSALNLFNVIASLADFGLNNTLSLRLAQLSASQDTPQAERLFRKLLIWKTALACLITGGLCLLAEPLCRYYYHYQEGAGMFRILALYCISYQLLLFLMAALNGLRSFTAMNLMQFSFYFFPMVLLLFCGTSEPHSASLCFIGGEFIGLLLFGLILLFRSGFPVSFFRNRGESDSLRVLFGISKWFAAGNITLTFMGCADILLLAFFAGAEQTGIYNIAMSISLIVTPLAFASTITMPIITDCWQRNAVEEVRGLIHSMLILFLWLFFCGTLFFLLFAPELIRILFSSGFLPAAPALRILGPAILLSAVLTFIYGVLNGIGHYRAGNLCLSLGIPGNLLCQLLLIPSAGLAGAAFGTFAGFLLPLLLMIFFLLRHFSWFRFPVFLTAAALLFLAGGMLFLNSGFLIRTGFFAVSVSMISILTVIRYRLYFHIKTILSGGK